jgi:hypothetical protein
MTVQAFASDLISSLGAASAAQVQTTLAAATT